MFRNDLRNLVDGLDKSFKREYSRFDEFSDVVGLNEYKDFVVGLRDSGILIEFDRISKYVTDDSNFDEGSYKPSSISNDFFKMANNKLYSSVIPIYFASIHGFVTSANVEALLMLINFNYFYYSDMRCSRIKSIEKVFGGDIIQYVSFFTDEFKSMHVLPDFDESFFDDLRNVDYEDDRARILEDFLRCGYLSLIIDEQEISWSFFNNIKLSAKYFIACNALKRGSLKASCEDVVVGYTLALRMIGEDIREYVIKYSDGDESDLYIDNSENNVYLKDDENQDEGNGVGKGVAFIFAVLAFLEVIFLISFVTILFAPELISSHNQANRLAALFLSFIVARKFYDYLRSNRKLMVMLTFIIVFIITIVIGLTMF